MGLTFRHDRESRARQESDVRAAGAEHIIHVGQQCESWRDVIGLVRDGDQIWLPWLALAATERGKDKTAPSGQPAEFILEVHERGGVVIECKTGRRSDDKAQRRDMIADAVRSLRQGGRRPPPSGNPPGRPANAYSAAALSHNRAAWFSRHYSTNEAAASHMLEGMTAREAWQRWGKSGRPWKRSKR